MLYDDIQMQTAGLSRVTKNLDTQLNTLLVKPELLRSPATRDQLSNELGNLQMVLAALHDLQSTITEAQLEYICDALSYEHINSEPCPPNPLGIDPLDMPLPNPSLSNSQSGTEENPLPVPSPGFVSELTLESNGTFSDFFSSWASRNRCIPPSGLNELSPSEGSSYSAKIALESNPTSSPSAKPAPRRTSLRDCFRDYLRDNPTREEPSPSRSPPANDESPPLQIPAWQSTPVTHESPPLEISAWQSTPVTDESPPLEISAWHSTPVTDESPPLEISAWQSNPVTDESTPLRIPAWQSNAIRPRLTFEPPTCSSSSRCDNQPIPNLTSIFIPLSHPTNLFASLSKLTCNEAPPPASINATRASRTFRVLSPSPSPQPGESEASGDRNRASRTFRVPSPSPSPPPAESEVNCERNSREIRRNQRCAFVIGPSPSPIRTDFFARIGEWY